MYVCICTHVYVFKYIYICIQIHIYKWNSPGFRVSCHVFFFLVLGCVFFRAGKRAAPICFWFSCQDFSGGPAPGF